MTKRGLGKGLDALLATSSLAREKQQVASLSQSMSAEGELADLSISNLKPGIYQPRKDLSQKLWKSWRHPFSLKVLSSRLSCVICPPEDMRSLRGTSLACRQTSGVKASALFDQASGRSWCDRHGIDREHSARRSECDGRGTSARAFTKRI